MLGLVATLFLLSEIRAISRLFGVLRPQPEWISLIAVATLVIAVLMALVSSWLFVIALNETWEFF